MRFAIALVSTVAAALAIDIETKTEAKQLEGGIIDMPMPSMDNITVNTPEEAPIVGAAAPADSTAQPETVNATEEAPKVEASPYGPYPGYFDIPNHQSMDYSHSAPETLPGADFNKQVYEFDEHKQIWDQ